MQHPVTTEYKESKNHIQETLKAIKSLNYPTFWFWPNVDAGSDGTSNGIRAFRELEQPTNIHFFKNMEPLDFLKFLHCKNTLWVNKKKHLKKISIKSKSQFWMAELSIKLLSISNNFETRTLKLNERKAGSSNIFNLTQLYKTVIDLIKFRLNSL